MHHLDQNFLPLPVQGESKGKRGQKCSRIFVYSICLLTICALLTGCLGSRGYTPVRYYSIEPLSDDTPRATRSWTIPLGIQSFTAATRYRERMLYRLSEVEVNFYEYDRWVEPPEEMVTHVVAAALRASGLFPQVRHANNLQLPAWLLSAVLLRFDEVRGPHLSRAECWLQLELRRAQDEQLLWSKTLRAAAPLNSKSPAALATAMTTAVHQIARQLITELQTADLPGAE
jgi:ABC-type uncharacterized transport system auxiliary subunit